MPSGAVRLPGAAAVTAAAAGVVTAEPSWMAERRRRGNPSGVGPAQPPVAVAVEDVRTPDTPLVACPRPLSAGRTSVHWVGRTSGVQRDRCPRDRRDPGVRTDTPPVTVARRPRCPHRAGSWHASVRRGRPRLGASGALCRGGRRVAGSWLPELGSGGEGMVVGSAVPGSDRVDGRPAACMDPRRLRRRARRRADMGAGPAQGAGRLAGGTRRSSCSHVAVQVRPGPVAGVMAGWAGRC